MIRQIIVGVAIAAAATLTACGSAGSAGNPAHLPACMTGNGQTASTLTLHQTGSQFAGVYTNSGLHYDVTGQLSGDTFTSVWTAAGVSLRISGQWNASGMTLNDPTHQFGTDHFDATLCP